MSLTLGRNRPVSSGLRNSQADAGEMALLRVCPFGTAGVNHNGKLERPVCWISEGGWPTVLSKLPYRRFDTQLIFNQVEKRFESHSYKRNKA